MHEPAAPPLPTGTVTFLFTDIEGSTRRWERHRAAMRDAVRVHDRIMRAAIAARGGAVFKTIGDAFCAAFPHSEWAVQAALDAQRGLQAADFAAVEGLHVRMALHTGTADERDGDYFGPTLNRVARLLSIGNGEQVLLSAVATELTKNALPAGTSLVDLGTHALKDLAQPEHVFQLVSPDMRSDSRGLRSGRAAPTNLPAPASSFVGRESEVAQTIALLGEHRLVTIVGPGGIGKTRIALRAAAWVVEARPDGVWLAELAPVSDPSLVPGVVAKAVGLPIPADGDALAGLIAALRDKRLLLVLDNCEHVLDAAGTLASAILRDCPDVTILASSRRPLSRSGEAVQRILAMPQDDAVALFVDRARSADVRFTPTDGIAADIADICRRVDGIPLAVELAAARLRLLGARSLRDRLEHRLQLLVGGGRDAAARQQTLRATIDWSHDLLGAREQQVFRTLGIFADGFTPEAVASVAGAVLADADDAFEVLCSLEDQSLVVVDFGSDSTRFRLLEAMREYALEALDSHGERERAATRHLDFFRSLAARAEAAFMDSGSDTAYALALAGEVDDVRSALAWSLESGEIAAGAELLSAIGRPWSRLGIGAEGIARVEAFIRRMPASETRLLARLWTEVAYLAGNSMRTARAYEAAGEGLRYARAAGDPATLVWSLSFVALVAARLRHFDEADAALDEARSLAGPQASVGQRITELEVRAFVAQLRKDLEGAASAYEEQLALLRESGDEDGAAYRTMSLAETEHARGNTLRAAELARGLLPVATRLGRELNAGLLSNLAGYLLALDDTSAGRNAACDSIELLADHDPTSPWIVTALEHFALALALGGECERAARLAGYCEATFARIGFQREAAEETTRDRLMRTLRDALAPAELVGLEDAGAALPPAAAIGEARR